MNESIYSNTIISKTGLEIPVLKNGKTIESRYNPEREADGQILQFEEGSAFFLVIGIGSGILIKKLLENIPSARIIAVEYSDCDLSFLMNLPVVKDLSENDFVSFATNKKLCDTLCANYLPSRDGNISIYENRVWASENKDKHLEIKKQINLALTKIKSDFSVQAHFGKIWQKNIVKNLKLASKNKLSFFLTQSELKKKAAVIAAGPTLDKTINKLNSDEYYIIATDTAFSALLKNHIIPDCVVSLDGQEVSLNHFMRLGLRGLTKTTFFFDLCSNFTAAKKICDKKLRLFYFTSGHPLSEYASLTAKNSFLPLYSGSGTVTISAVDLALKLGFSKIDVFGADFSYSSGKSYTKGTYLDSLYAKASSRILSTEKQFASLMFRTELKKTKNNTYTTNILESYKESLENYLKNMNLNFINSDDLYRITLTKNDSEKLSVKNLICETAVQNFNYEEFIKKLKREGSYIHLLPYIAWLRKKMNFASCSFEDLCKLATESLVSYN